MITITNKNLANLTLVISIFTFVFSFFSDRRFLFFSIALVIFTHSVLIKIIANTKREFFNENFFQESKLFKYVGFLVIFITILLTQNVYLNIETIDWDIHSYLVAAQDINNGNLPLEKQWESKGPVFFYLYNFISNLSNKSYVNFRILNDLILFGISLTFFSIQYENSKRLLNSFLDTLFFVLLMSITWATLEYSELYALIFIGISYKIISTKKKKISLRDLFLSGALVSLSTLINQGTILFMFSFLVILFLKIENINELKKSFFAFLTGFGIPHVFFILVYLINGLFRVYFATFISIPFGYTRSSFNYLNEFKVFLRDFYSFNLYLYASIIILIFTIIFLILFQRMNSYKFLSNEKSVYLLNLASILFYILGSHGYKHHLMFLLFSLPLFLGEINLNKIKLPFYIFLVLSFITIGITSSKQSFDNLKNINQLESHYPLKNLSEEILQNFEREFTVLALDYVLILYYLELPNYSYIVHPTNHYEDFITDELENTQMIVENNIDNMICYKIDDGCVEPDIILCSHIMIIKGIPTRNNEFNCEVSDYNKNFVKINTDKYRYDENLTLYYDPYKEIGLFLNQGKDT